MRSIAEYEAWLAEQHDPVLLRAEALERMRVNVGLLGEIEQLKREVRTTAAPPERGAAGASGVPGARNKKKPST